MGKYRRGENTGTRGDIRITEDEEGHSVIRVGTEEMVGAVKKAVSNEKGVTIEKIGGEKKVCLSEPGKNYGDSICQIMDDLEE